MNFLLRSIISVLVISLISCSQQSTHKPSTTPKPEPDCCPYSIKDIENVVQYFYTNKAAASVEVQNVLLIQQTLMRDATCTKQPCSNRSASLLNVLRILLGKSTEAANGLFCPLPAKDPAAVAQFDRYFGGNQRAIEMMKLEAERIFHLLSELDSECACEIKRRIVAAAYNYGRGLISCTDVSIADLSVRLKNIQPSKCIDQKRVAFFTNYNIQNTYFTAESDLRKCKTKFIDAFNVEKASIIAALDCCVTEAVCSQY